jgi:hypothetical protein
LAFGVWASEGQRSGPGGTGGWLHYGINRARAAVDGLHGVSSTGCAASQGVPQYMSEESRKKGGSIGGESIFSSDYIRLD